MFLALFHFTKDPNKFYYNIFKSRGFQNDGKKKTDKNLFLAKKSLP